MSYAVHKLGNKIMKKNYICTLAEVIKNLIRGNRSSIYPPNQQNCKFNVEILATRWWRQQKENYMIDDFRWGIRNTGVSHSRYFDMWAVKNKQKVKNKQISQKLKLFNMQTVAFQKLLNANPLHCQSPLSVLVRHKFLCLYFFWCHESCPETSHLQHWHSAKNGKTVKWKTAHTASCTSKLKDSTLGTRLNKFLTEYLHLNKYLVSPNVISEVVHMSVML